jgi:hypothetical protein
LENRAHLDEQLSKWGSILLTSRHINDWLTSIVATLTFKCAWECFV